MSARVWVDHGSSCFMGLFPSFLLSCLGRCRSNFASSCNQSCFQLGKDTDLHYTVLFTLQWTQEKLTKLDCIDHHSPHVTFCSGDSLRLDACGILQSYQLLSHMQLSYFCSRVSRVFLLLWYCLWLLSTWATLISLEKTGQGATLTERISSLDGYPEWTRLVAPSLSMCLLQVSYILYLSFHQLSPALIILLLRT